MIATKSGVKRRKPRAPIPDSLVYEIIDGRYADMHPDNYLFKKTQKLLDFGVGKVVWITTHSRKVTVATPKANWQVMDWDKEVEVLDGMSFNIGEYLTDEGVTLP